MNAETRNAVSAPPHERLEPVDLLGAVDRDQVGGSSGGLPVATVWTLKWGGWTNPRLGRWMVAAFVLLVVGLALHLVGGRPFDVVWLVFTLAAAVVLVVGHYRHSEPRE